RRPPRGWHDPVLVAADQCQPRCAERVLWKTGGQDKGETSIGSEALQIADHVAALGRIEVERRRVPALRLEDGSQQEWLPGDGHTGGRRERLDAHGGEVGIGGGELVP